MIAKAERGSLHLYVSVGAGGRGQCCYSITTKLTHNYTTHPRPSSSENQLLEHEHILLGPAQDQRSELSPLCEFASSPGKAVPGLTEE